MMKDMCEDFPENAAWRAISIRDAKAALFPELVEVLAWFIDDIDGNATKMIDFDAAYERGKATLAKAREIG